jgi:hypothetical protein
MKSLAYALLSGGIFLSFSCAAQADPWVDYTPAKGVWDKTYVHVDSSRIDDYLVALKKTWVPEQERAKKHGLVDQYVVQVLANPATTGPNVMLGIHYLSMAALDPEKSRDMAMQAEAEKAIPKAASAAEQEVRAKYRTIVREELWTSVDYGK